MESDSENLVSLSKSDWVEAIERLRETVGEDGIYVIAQPLGTSLYTTSLLPLVDTQGIRFPLQRQSSGDEFESEMYTLLPLRDTEVEFATVRDRTGNTVFLVTIWLDGLERDDFQTKVCFSTNLEALKRVAGTFL